VGPTVAEEPKTYPKPVTVEEVPEGAEPHEPHQVNKSEETLVTLASSNTAAPIPPHISHTMGNILLDHTVKPDYTKLVPTLADAPVVPVVPVASSSPVETPNTPSPPKETTSRPSFAVCCNSCDRTIPNVHYHCGTCDDGDFDLCLDCINMGITCYGSDHWMIKRFVKDNTLVNSHTERLPPKPITIKKPVPATEVTYVARATPVVPIPIIDLRPAEVQVNVRTCNNCISGK